MKTIQLYTAILNYLNSETVEHKRLVVLQIIASPPDTSSSSYEVTIDSLEKLWQCVNHPLEIEDDDEWSTTTNDFVKSAFKDLSSIRDPKAMELFDRLARTCLPTYADGQDMLVYARSIKERPNGSAVIVLHVSDLERFRRIIEHHDYIDSSTEFHTLEEGLLFGS